MQKNVIVTGKYRDQVVTKKGKGRGRTKEGGGEKEKREGPQAKRGGDHAAKKAAFSEEVPALAAITLIKISLL